MDLSRYIFAVNVLMLALAAGLFLFGSLDMFILAYIGVFVFSVMRTLSGKSSKRIKLYLTLAYLIALTMQTVFCEEVVFAEQAPFYEQPFRRLFAVVMVLLPLAVSRYVSVGKYSRFYLPSLQDLSTISFAELKNGAASITKAVETIERAGESLSAENLRAVAEDLPRHDSFRYINEGSLTDDYFKEAALHLDDPHLYIIISRTGSPASEIISVFTQKQYNHASLAFDRELKTIVSYNGGERVYPPGLNMEMLDFFNKKPDASILVYKLDCLREQKERVLQKVAEINRDGSAYNMIGLVLKYSHKPNIMFCSQFVYRMLELVGLNYFSAKPNGVKPTDLIEQDYFRKLSFDYEIRFENRG